MADGVTGRPVVPYETSYPQVIGTFKYCRLVAEDGDVGSRMRSDGMKVLRAGHVTSMMQLRVC
jgi:hypothetical protein